MSEPLAYENGRLVAASRVSVPIFDQGFVQGVTVAEQLRTFDGKLFRFADHIRRLRRSLEIVQVDCGLTDEQWGTLADELVTHNLAMQADGDDLGLCVFVTPGPYPTFAAAPDVVPIEDLRPRVVAHTFPIPFGQWAKTYVDGQPLAVSSIRQVPGFCWPTELKCRSRMHYYLADLDAAKRFPGSRALLLDESGAVCEASTANLFAYFEGEGFVAPPSTDVLPGISLSTVDELAKQIDVPFVRRIMMPEELKTASEVLLCSTSPCVLPVTQIDGEPIGDGKPGPQFERLLNAWSEHVGLDIAAQAKRFADR